MGHLVGKELVQKPGKKIDGVQRQGKEWILDM